MLPLPDEMLKDLNVNTGKNVNTRFQLIKVFPPAVTEPSAVQMITSQPAAAHSVT